MARARRTPSISTTEMKNVMFDDVGIYRNEKGMRGAIEKVRELQGTLQARAVTDTGSIFNTELLNAWELGNMLEIAEVVARCALNRKESRGGHSREDYPEARRSELVEAYACMAEKNGKVEIGYKPVVITKYPAEGESVLSQRQGLDVSQVSRDATREEHSTTQENQETSWKSRSRSSATTPK